jgi:hypothetical protein
MVVEQPNRELVEQLSNARYASLTSRAVTDAARRIIDRLVETLEATEDYRKSRKNKRSKKAQFSVRNGPRLSGGRKDPNQHLRAPASAGFHPPA